MTAKAASQVRDRRAEPEKARSGWMGVASIAAGTFLLVTSEFLPIGLLSPIAASLNVSPGRAGLAVTAPGLVAAIAAPLLALLARNTDRRRVVILATTAIVLSNIIVFVAPSFAVFLGARFVLGLGVGALWTFAVAVGRRLVPDSAGARATSVISLGISAGTIFGMPVGAGLGAWVGWRMAFLANALFGVLVVALQIGVLPRVPAVAAIDAKRLLSFAKVPMARIGFLASALAIGGHFMAYTFLEPYLRDVLQLGPAGVTKVLAGYALAGIVGALLGEQLGVRDIRRALAATTLAVGLSIMISIVVASVPVGGIAIVMAWGLAFGAVPVCVQIWMHASSPALFEAGSALMVSAVQIALAAGAAVGGALVDSAGIAAAFWGGAIACTVGGFVPLAYRKGLRDTAEPGQSGSD